MGFWLWWVAASSAGLTAGCAVVGAISDAVGTGAFDLLNGAFMGAVVGVMQSLVLRRQVSWAGWWVLASVLGLTVGHAVGSVAFDALDGAALDAADGAVLGAIVGATTGIALVWLLRPPVPDVVEVVFTGGRLLYGAALPLLQAAIAFGCLPIVGAVVGAAVGAVVGAGVAAGVNVVCAVVGFMLGAAVGAAYWSVKIRAPRGVGVETVIGSVAGAVVGAGVGIGVGAGAEVGTETAVAAGIGAGVGAGVAAVVGGGFVVMTAALVVADLSGIMGESGAHFLRRMVFQAGSWVFASVVGYALGVAVAAGAFGAVAGAVLGAMVGATTGVALLGRQAEYFRIIIDKD